MQSVFVSPVEAWYFASSTLCLLSYFIPFRPDSLGEEIGAVGGLNKLSSCKCLSLVEGDSEVFFQKFKI